MTTVATLSPRDVARRCGVSTDTLRHYERKGVVPPASRGSNGYRRYPVDTVARVQLVQRALVVGFTLDELAGVLRERDRGAPPCRSVRDLVARRLAELEARLRSLRALRADLRRLVATWDVTLAGVPPGEPAHLLQTLAGRPAIERARGGARLARISNRR